MRRKLFQVEMALCLLIALILALSLLPVYSSPAAALSMEDYFEISYEPVEYSKTDIHGDEVFYATIIGTATCTNSLPLPVSEAWITGLVTATHQVSGAKVTLNTNYKVTVAPFPNKKGKITQARQDISLQFPENSQSGTYNVVGELIEAKVNILLGWLTVTSFLPPYQVMDSVTYTAPDGVGGEGGEPTPPDTTYISDSFDGQGIATKSFKVLSEDGKCTLAVNQGTKALTESGQPLEQISIVREVNPPAPPVDAEIIGLTYSFGPGGATFDPPIDLTFAYSQNSIPEGVAEKDLVITMWDVDVGKWIALDDCIVNTTTRTITAKVAHFTYFTVLAYTKPAVFIIGALSITPREVSIGDEVTISALVTNTGNLEGIYRVALGIDNQVVEIQEIHLAGGAREIVIFKITESAASIYSVDINGLAGSFVVKSAIISEAEPKLAPTSPAVGPEDDTITPPPNSPNWPALYGVIAAMVVIGLLVFLLTRRSGHAKSSL